MSLRDPRFRECVADLTAPIRGLPKDELIGEDIRQHRRTLRLAQGGVTLLALLTTLAVIAAFIAVGQRNTAREQTRLATARQVASAAVANIPQRLDLSMLFAVQAYRQQRTPQTEAALFQAVTASPHLVRFADNGTPVTVPAPFEDGTRMVIGGEDGTVRIWNLDGDRGPMVIADLDQRVTAVAVDEHGRQVAVGSSDGVVVVVDTTTRHTTVLQAKGPTVTGVALDPPGRQAAMVDDNYRVKLFDVVPGRLAGSADTDAGAPEVVHSGPAARSCCLGEAPARGHAGASLRYAASPSGRESKHRLGATPPATPATADGSATTSSVFSSLTRPQVASHASFPSRRAP